MDSLAFKLDVDERFSAPVDDQTLARAEKAMLIVPENWSSKVGEVIYAGTTESVMKLFRQNGAAVELLRIPAGPLALRNNRSSDWVAPTLFVSQLLLTQNPACVSVALGIISNYLTDLFKGRSVDPKVRVNLIHCSLDGKRLSKIRYEGPVSGMDKINEMLARLNAK